MQLPRNPGLEAMGRIVRHSINFYSDAFKSYSEYQRKRVSEAISRPQVLPPLDTVLPSLEPLKRPVESLVKGLNDVVSGLTSRPDPVDYKAVVGTFLPPGARLLKPLAPAGAADIQFEDLDGDGRREMIASYKTHDGIKTLLLKKDDVQWYKMGEISHPEADRIHYRNSADVAGDGKKALLLGLTARTGTNTFYAYSVSNGSAKKLFSRKYSMLELVKARGGAPSQTSFALWNEEAPDIYDIEVVRWNGLELEPLDRTRYLNSKVAPYYIQKLRQNQNDTVNWFNLANTFARAGNKSGAAKAIRLGLERDPSNPLKDRFLLLKSKL